MSRVLDLHPTSDLDGDAIRTRFGEGFAFQGSAWTFALPLGRRQTLTEMPDAPLNRVISAMDVLQQFQELPPGIIPSRWVPAAVGADAPLRESVGASGWRDAHPGARGDR